MQVKDQLVLLGSAHNVLDMNQNEIDLRKISDAEKKSVLSILEVFSEKASSHISHKYVNIHIKNQLKNIDFVKLPKYSLPTAYNKTTRKALINISVFGRKNILNLSDRDLYTLVFNAHVVSYYSSGVAKLPFTASEVISHYMSSLLLKIFSKRFGLTGSYLDLIPQLRFIVSSYIQTSFFGIKQEDTYNKAAQESKVVKKHLSIDIDNYHLLDVKEFIKCVGDAGVLPGLNTYIFISTMMKYFGIFCLPMFEDSMRFCSVLTSSSINENTLYPQVFMFYQPKLYEQLLSTILKELK